MQNLNTLWQVVNAASQVKDIAQKVKSYQFGVREPTTLYLHTDNSIVRLIRWSRPLIEVKVTLQASFGWRIATDQDEAGVYIASKRRAVVGGLSSAIFELYVPRETYLVLKLDACSLEMDNINGTVEIPPLEDVTTLTLNNTNSGMG